MTKGEHPFGEQPDRLRNLIDGNPVYLSKLKDPAAKDLISWMLSNNPNDRPSAVKALNHPYLQSKKEQFEMLSEVGNQEVKARSEGFNIALALNMDRTDWKMKMGPDILKYLSTDPLTGKISRFGSSWTECLRLIRNVSQHWYDRPRPLPQPEAFYLVGDPQEYFLNVFPSLSVAVHQAVRSSNSTKVSDHQMESNIFGNRAGYFGKS